MWWYEKQVLASAITEYLLDKAMDWLRFTIVVRPQSWSTKIPETLKSPRNRTMCKQRRTKCWTTTTKVPTKIVTTPAKTHCVRPPKVDHEEKASIQPTKKASVSCLVLFTTKTVMVLKRLATFWKFRCIV